MLPVKKILCPTDFSESSKMAVQAANELAQKFDASVVLFHVVSPAPVVESMGGPIGYTANASTLQLTKYYDELADTSRETLNQWASEYFEQNVHVEIEVKSGNPYDTVVEFAEAEAMDLIVTTTHGRTGLKRLFMGSVAEGIIRHAQCPVLVIRIKEEAL